MEIELEKLRLINLTDDTTEAY